MPAIIIQQMDKNHLAPEPCNPFSATFCQTPHLRIVRMNAPNGRCYKTIASRTELICTRNADRPFSDLKRDQLFSDAINAAGGTSCARKQRSNIYIYIYRHDSLPRTIKLVSTARTQRRPVRAPGHNG